jgi:translation initiation factor 1
VRIALDRRHRRGKTMTIVSGAPGDDAELALICRELKKLLATGGSVYEGQLELQGDHCQRVAAYFAARGVKTKRVGG